jgi:uncharacterized membrane-anchored protein YjiN (DUF445 family)
MSDPGVARTIADRAVAALPRMMATVSDTDVRAFFHRALSRQLASVNLPVVLGNVLALLRDSDQHHALLDQSLIVARRYLEENSDLIYDQVDAQSKWWIPRSVDRKVATAIVGGITDFLGDMSKPDHTVRAQFDAAVDDLIANLRTRPATQQQVRDFAERILNSPATQDYLANLWQHLRAQLEDSSGIHSQSLRATVADGIRSIGRTLDEAPDMRERLNAWLDEAVRTGIVPWRREIGAFITEVVRSWDPKTLTDRAELAIGRDLQFIRVNGTIVGGLVGCALYLISVAVAG